MTGSNVDQVVMTGSNVDPRFTSENVKFNDTRWD